MFSSRLLVAFLAIGLAVAPASAGTTLLLGAGKGTPGAAAVMMTTPILGLASSTTGPGASATNYAPLTWGSGCCNLWGTSVRTMKIATTGNMGNLVVFYPGPMGAGTYLVSLYKNGAQQLLQCTINVTGPVQACTNNTTIGVTAGDTIGWQSIGTGGSAQTSVYISATFTSTVGQESPIFISQTSAGSPVNATQYTSLGYSHPWNASEVTVSSLLATGGTIDQLMLVDGATPANGGSYAFTIFKNGVATALTCTITDPIAVFCNDLNTGHAVHFAGGDTVSLQAVPSTSPAPTTANFTSGSVRWVPDTTNEAPLMQVAVSVPAASGTRFFNAGGTGAGASTEASEYNIAPIGMTIKNFWSAQGASTGGSNTRPFALRAGATATAAGVSGVQADQTLGCLTGGVGQVSASFTGTITTATTLTVSAVTGTIRIGQLVTGAGVTANTTITGGSGTVWTITSSANVGPIAMTTGDVITVAGALVFGCRDSVNSYSAVTSGLLDFSTVPVGANTAMVWHKTAAVVTVP
jgi:hypothetical protein